MPIKITGVEKVTAETIAQSMRKKKSVEEEIASIFCISTGDDMSYINRDFVESKENIHNRISRLLE